MTIESGPLDEAELQALPEYSELEELAEEAPPVSAARMALMTESTSCNCNCAAISGEIEGSKLTPHQKQRRGRIFR